MNTGNFTLNNNADKTIHCDFSSAGFKIPPVVIPQSSRWCTVAMIGNVTTTGCDITVTWVGQETQAALVALALFEMEH